MTTTEADQRASQLQACHVLEDLLARAQRDNLPVLSWTAGASGPVLVGYGTREAVTAWAAALGIHLQERAWVSGGSRIRGARDRVDTPGGWAAVTLTADVYEEDKDA